MAGEAAACAVEDRPRLAAQGKGRAGRDPDLVAVVMADRISLFETAAAMSVFGAGRPGGGYRVVAVGTDPGAVATSAGLTIGPAQPLDAIARAGIVVVPTWPSPNQPAPAPLLDAIRATHQDGAVLVGLCLGVFVLAAAGVLDGRRATTHWHWMELLRRRYPAITVDRTARFVDEGSVVTSAGAAAGLDACLHVVRRERGGEAAAAVARRLVLSTHDTRARFAVGEDRDDIHDLLAWVAEHLAEEVTVAQLAARVHLSRRTFNRQFREVTGASPLQWLIGQRVAAARQLLDTTDLGVDQVARRVGFATAVALRPRFKKLVGVSPQQYRTGRTDLP